MGAGRCWGLASTFREKDFAVEEVLCEFCTMRAITGEEIVQAWNHMCDLDEKGSQAMAQQFIAEQPALGVYLLAQSEELAGGPEESRSFEIVVSAWQAMTQAAGRQLKPVSPEQIEAAQEANTQALGQLDEASESEFMDWAGNMVEHYNQREIIGFTLEILMAGNEENPELAPDSIGLELLAVKTVVDCLDQHG